MGSTAAIYGLSALSSASSAYNQSVADRSAGKYSSKMYAMNARMAEFQAEDAKARGDKEYEKVLRQGERSLFAIRREGKKTVGEQRVALAAQGVNIEMGSAKDIVDETKTFSMMDQIRIESMAKIDAMTVRNNAWREAFGYKMQAMEFAGAGDYATMASKSKAMQSLLTGGMDVVRKGFSAYAEYKGSKVPKIKEDEIK